MHEKLAVEIQKILQRKNLVFTSTFVDFFSKDEHVQQLDQLLLHLGVDFNRIIACEQLDLFAKKCEIELNTILLMMHNYSVILPPDLKNVFSAVALKTKVFTFQKLRKV